MTDAIHRYYQDDPGRQNKLPADVLFHAYFTTSGQSVQNFLKATATTYVKNLSVSEANAFQQYGVPVRKKSAEAYGIDPSFLNPQIEGTSPADVKKATHAEAAEAQAIGNSIPSVPRTAIVAGRRRSGWTQHQVKEAEVAERRRAAAETVPGVTSRSSSSTLPSAAQAGAAVSVASAATMQPVSQPTAVLMARNGGGDAVALMHSENVAVRVPLMRQ
ncbi:hypothetical protein [Streptomyces sp. NPDC058394]|uniref:hypothetical protein n=1 Tax=Streptomyces sp. NPDC058394 TaxID=3346477 RepID=UPI00364E5CD1